MSISLPPVIFVHFGNTPYLTYTLSIAKLTNPDREMVLIGDDENKETALNCGWKHAKISQTNNNLFNIFQKKYKLIATEHHPDRHRTEDLNKFCFERYFHALYFAQENRIEKFWMFDSDDIIVENLNCFECKLFEEDIQFTRMAYNTTPRGLMNTQSLENFCISINDNFSNEEFISAYQKILYENPEKAKFSNIQSGNYIAAFSDMNSGDLFFSHQKEVHLADSIPGWHFDDCILHANHFNTTTIGSYSKMNVKEVEFNGKNFTVCRGGQAINFATINGSGLPWQTFSWFFLMCKIPKFNTPNEKSHISGPTFVSGRNIVYFST
jgi:hypothetical protein